jgi:hypothetical protein
VIGRFEADLGQYLWHLAQQIERLPVRLPQINPKTMERDDRVLGEAATPFGGGDFASPTDSISS